MGMHHDLSPMVLLLLSYFFSSSSFCDALLRCYDGPARNQTGAQEASRLPPVGGFLMYRFLYDTNDWDVDYLG